MRLIVSISIGWLLALVGALVGIGLYDSRLHRVAIAAPHILNPISKSISNLGRSPVANGEKEQPKPFPGRVSVIIPAYNEAENIRDCLVSVLDSTPPTGQAASSEPVQIWVVDDQSSDETWAIAQKVQTTRADPRLHLLAGQARPTEQNWVGKNWACVQAVQQATGDFLLFLDADVRLKPGGIESAIAAMEQSHADLLTCWPQIICGCWAEWLAQPLIVGILAASLPFAEVNDPKSETVFAVGPFMLFRRTAYERLGGHQAVASQVVEDVELARLVKQTGLKLNYALGHELASVQMYKTAASLWEGWSKNWHLGCQRQIPLTLYSALMPFWICTVPWLGLIVSLVRGFWMGFGLLEVGAIAIALISIMLQYQLRSAIEQLSTIPPRYWWLTGIGGILVTAIVIASLIKTETGWGWTWRGRALR